MATKRRPIHSQTNMNFRPAASEVPRNETKGTRPTATPTSVKEVLLVMVLHICKKIIFFDTNLKVALYLCSLFLISLIGDFMPFPKTYLARSDNLFNVYFVKLGWAWTLVLSGPFLFMTSFTLCCGNIQKSFRQHMPRILIATGFWFIWTKAFNIIETSYGRCSARSLYTKSSCLKAGHLWYGFDISGHAFILIYSSLVLIEEAKPIIKWETIKEYLRDEEHNRSIAEPSCSNPLRNLTDAEIRILKYLYDKYTPAIRTLFIGMCALQLLWDIMLVSTMLYYHRMVEKVISGIVAVLTWFFTYRAWYPSTFLPDPVGRGNFIYQKEKQTLLRRQPSLTPTQQSQTSPSSRGQVPRFMGMPLYTNMKPQPQTQAPNGPSSGFSTDLVT